MKIGQDVDLAVPSLRFPPRKDFARVSRQPTFDSYHKWLGIPPAEQPPHHYRLLGVTVFEADREVLSTAVRRQRGFLRQYANGPHAASAQQLWREIASAGKCLLDTEQKAAYDAKLKTQIAQTSAVTTATATKDAANDFSYTEPLPSHIRTRIQTRRQVERSQRFDAIRANAKPFLLLAAIVVSVALICVFIFVPSANSPAVGDFQTENPIQTHSTESAEIPAQRAEEPQHTPHEEKLPTVAKVEDPNIHLKNPPVTAATTAQATGIVEPKLNDSSPAQTSTDDHADEPTSVASVKTHAQIISAIEQLGGTVQSRETAAGERQVFAVNLSNTNADADLIISLKDLKSLQNLELQGTQLTDDILAIVKNFPELTELNLSETQISNAGLAHLIGLNQLEKLWVNQTQVTDDGMQHLRNLNKLERLDLGHTSVGDAGLMQLQNLTRLKTLALDDTQVSDEGLKVVVTFSELKSLFVVSPNLTSSGLTRLRRLRMLKKLIVGGPQVSRGGVRYLQSVLPDCRIRLIR